MEGPYCPMCHNDNLCLEEGDNDLSSWITQQVSCRRCQTGFAVRYQYVFVEDITVTQPYGPPYVTRDAQRALMALACDQDETVIRGDGALFVVGFTTWLRMQGYNRKEGWSIIDAQVLAGDL